MQYMYDTLVYGEWGNVIRLMRALVTTKGTNDEMNFLNGKLLKNPDLESLEILIYLDRWYPVNGEPNKPISICYKPSKEKYDSFIKRYNKYIYKILKKVDRPKEYFLNLKGYISDFVRDGLKAKIAELSCNHFYNSLADTIWLNPASLSEQGFLFEGKISIHGKNYSIVLNYPIGTATNWEEVVNNKQVDWHISGPDPMYWSTEMCKSYGGKSTESLKVQLCTLIGDYSKNTHQYVDNALREIHNKLGEYITDDNFAKFMWRCPFSMTFMYGSGSTIMGSAVASFYSKELKLDCSGFPTKEEFANWVIANLTGKLSLKCVLSNYKEIFNDEIECSMPGDLTGCLRARLSATERCKVLKDLKETIIQKYWDDSHRLPKKVNEILNDLNATKEQKRDIADEFAAKEAGNLISNFHLERKIRLEELRPSKYIVTFRFENKWNIKLELSVDNETTFATVNGFSIDIKKDFSKNSLVNHYYVGGANSYKRFEKVMSFPCSGYNINILKQKILDAIKETYATDLIWG